MKQQKIEKRIPPKQVEIVDERPQTVTEETEEADETSKVPVRTVIYMEVGDMERERVLYLVKQISSSYENSGGAHYVLPVRHGRISGDIAFESEWESVVREVFEIREGQICLKNNAQDVRIVREMI